MITAILLVAALVSCVFSEHRHHSGEHSGHHHDHSGHVDSDDIDKYNRHHEAQVANDDLSFQARVQAALLRNAAPALSIGESSSSDHERLARKQQRELEHLAEIEIRLAQAASAKKAKPKHFSYQAVFTRNTTQVCVANGGTIIPTNSTTPVPFDQLTGNLSVLCHNRHAGPVILIAKFSASNVSTDSFDGNHDGKDDVLEALNSFAAGQSVAQAQTSPTDEANLVSKFLLEVRNRATVNGGSINISSLIVTGRQNSKGAPFAIFGGATNRLLISPCFPVVQDLNWNIEMVGTISGWNGVFDASPQVTYNTFVATAGTDTHGNRVISSDVMASSTSPVNLVMGAFPNPNPAVPGVVQPGVLIGTVFFQQCTQFHYFS